MRCAVIGAGLLGMSTAWFLRDNGYKVRVFEKQSDVALGSSFANGGMLHASEANPWNQPGIFLEALKMLGKEDSALLIRPKALLSMLPWIVKFFMNSKRSIFEDNLSKNAGLAQYSLAVLRSQIKSLELESLINSTGTLKIYRNFESFEHGKSVAKKAAEFKNRYELLSSDDVIKLEPALVDIKNKIVGGVYYPDDLSGDAHEYCKIIKNNLEKRGCEFFYDNNVSSIVLNGHRLEGLRVGDKFYGSDVCIVAAGCFTPNLLPFNLPIEPVKGYSISIPLSDHSDSLPRIPVIDELKHAAFCPLKGKFRVAGTAEFAGFSENLTKSRIDNLFKLTREIYPRLTIPEKSNESYPWCGFRPMTPDGVGIISATEIDGLFINAGHGHLGWTMAPGSGKLLADIVSGKSPSLDAGLYSVNRFVN